MNHDDITSLASVYHRKDRWIPHEPPVPISLAVDLRRAHHERQAGRSKHMISGDLLTSEDFHLTAPHIGCGQEQFDNFLLAYPLKVHFRIEQVLERIDIHRIELIRRENTAQGIYKYVSWRMFESEFGVHLVEKGRCDDARGRHLGHL